MSGMMQAPPGAAVTYGRQSQHNDRSIEEQLDLGRARAADEGWLLLGEFHDGVSASRHTTKQRDDWPKVLALIAAGKVRVLWLWEPSRGDRKLSEWAKLLEDCADQGTRIYIETHHRLYDLTQPRDWKALADDGVDSVHESNKTHERVIRAMTANATGGKVHGRVPFGYRREYEITPAGKRKLTGQVPDPAEARTVGFIFRAIARGHTLLSITTYLVERRVPTRSGAAWSMTQVRGIALNRAYIAQRVHDPEGRRAGRRLPGPDAVWYPAKWPALVGEELFWTVQQILTDPKRVTTKPGKAKHLLSMIARCEHCETALSVTFRRRGGPHYCCRRSCVLIGMAELDDYVTAEVLARVVKHWKELAAAGRTDDRELVAARAELAKAEVEYQQLKGALKRKKLSVDAFADAEPGYLADVDAARKRVRELQAPPRLRWLLGDGPHDVAERWKAAAVPARRDAIRALAVVTVSRSPRRGPVRVPAAERVSVEPVTETGAPGGSELHPCDSRVSSASGSLHRAGGR